MPSYILEKNEQASLLDRTIWALAFFIAAIRFPMPTINMGERILAGGIAAVASHRLTRRKSSAFRSQEKSILLENESNAWVDFYAVYPSYDTDLIGIPLPPKRKDGSERINFEEWPTGRVILDNAAELDYAEYAAQHHDATPPMKIDQRKLDLKTINMLNGRFRQKS